MITAIIPAAGCGQRMKNKTPKQYLKIADKTILEWSLQEFISHPKIDKIIIAINKNDNFFKTTNLINIKKITTCIGGDSRFDSVYNAMRTIKNEDDNYFVIVHDAARPLFNKKDLNNLLEAKNDSGAILVANINETVKKVINGKIQKTLNRDNLYRALTPQFFKLSLLKKAFENAKNKKINITDESMAVENLGVNPAIIIGDANNIKITTKEDLDYAKELLISS
ncbi:MAG: 2-C-methyl-D-erythritol 4-phosphate cytidylyltransferase [Gammaproteobacteria bacterium]|nr:MAG: 2-C-methyl-D-erythritol 4-phosphate cytidylyltransferase [Gammaproteobacteria bacterium]